MITSAQVGKEWVGIVATVLSNWLQHINLKLDNQTTRPQTADIIQLKLSLLKKLVTHARAEKNFISYANSKEEQKGVAAEEFLIRSDRRCMQLFYAFECKLLEFQQPFYRHAQLSQTDNFWIFNGGWQLHDTETIHSKSFMVQLHLMSVTAYRRQLKHVVQFWKAKRRLRRVDQSFYGKMSANWSHIGCSLHWHINGSQLWTTFGWFESLVRTVDTRGKRLIKIQDLQVTTWKRNYYF